MNTVVHCYFNHKAFNDSNDRPISEVLEHASVEKLICLDLQKHGVRLRVFSSNVGRIL